MPGAATNLKVLIIESCDASDSEAIVTRPVCTPLTSLAMISPLQAILA